MERNIGDQLNKAFEAYRQASIEKDTAKRELQQKTEYYQRYTWKLEQQIEEQKQLISKLKAQLSSATKHASGEVKCSEPDLRKQEAETLSPCDQHPDGTACSSQRRKQLQVKEDVEAAAVSPHMLPGPANMENKDVLDAFRELQGKFHLIQALSRKQKDHLRKICKGNHTANEQQFSMPIQCTDVTAEQAEGPFSSAMRSEGADELSSPSLASRGVSPEAGDLVESLTTLSVKFPPPTDSEYEFLNSTPERQIHAFMGMKGLGVLAGVPSLVEEQSLGLPAHFPFPLSPPHTASPSGSLDQEAIRGPQQPVWSPDLCEATASETPPPHQAQVPTNCAFCKALVPQDHMFSHLNSHFQNPTSNGH
ncbi:TRAF family member-associated NF-kappa-B activator-like isoform X2 [Megalops cyprinoides]|nr:TRAF family member-associated NF-kappa-B activator-like isoform X2 [Megalops cyprinoides]XP_036401567.1 TRAF family member-associated NF-kappa-B activator-like isoform X2 [Megalops cyprinoides]XP_036401568.1 TRAF family member-associated NF-kappa-B activator-like isoform X2 [Megalops cyprinoides]